MARSKVYKAILERIFFDKRFGGYKVGKNVIAFRREDIENAASALKLPRPKNLGDAVYSPRMRSGLPDSIVATQPNGLEWQIHIVGGGLYEFRLESPAGIVPRHDLATTDIPDATPGIIRAFAQSDEQALLAVIRYNRLIDVFLGLTTYSLQSHLRSTARTSSGSKAQMEIDEIYVGLDKRGMQYAIPVQAKGGTDKLTALQTRQDLAWCAQNMPGAKCRPVSCQFMSEGRIALFELTVEDDTVKIVEERHYRLVPVLESPGARRSKGRRKTR
jgi:hypothetical protein